MKALTLVLLAVLPAGAQVTVGKAAGVSVPGVHQKLRIGLGTFSELERSFDAKLSSLGGVNEPVDLLGGTRGLYLDGYGAVFTTELSLLVAPGISPFKPVITDKEKALVHQRKIERLPKLKQAMREFVRTVAMTLFVVPDDQQIVVAVRLDYMKWEDTMGLPGLIVAKADRKGAVADDIKLEEQ